MNKYIRTKNSIYKVESEYMDLGIRKGFYVDEMALIRTDQVIIQADTIEELCDCFYWDWEDEFSVHNFINYSIAKTTWDEYVSDCLEDNEKPDRNMYGCIKTPKGIIYVAKMNIKGEVELL